MDGARWMVINNENELVSFSAQWQKHHLHCQCLKAPTNEG